MLATNLIERVSKLRSIVSLAGRENSRIVAGSIGQHLSCIGAETGSREMTEAIDTVRNTSFGFLSALHRFGDTAGAREALFNSLDDLEDCLS